MPELAALRSPQDFKRVLKDGARRRSGGIVMVRAPGIAGPPRVGLVVPRALGNAVTRNRMKRRLRHATRELGLRPGMDHVIIASEEVATVAFPELVAWLRRAQEGLEGA